MEEVLKEERKAFEQARAVEAELIRLKDKKVQSILQNIRSRAIDQLNRHEEDFETGMDSHLGKLIEELENERNTRMNEILDLETLIYQTISSLKRSKGQIRQTIESLEQCADVGFVYLRQKKQEELKREMEKMSKQIEGKVQAYRKQLQLKFQEQ